MQKTKLNRLVFVKAVQTIVLFIVFSFGLNAQNCDDVTLEEARKLYETGRFQEVLRTIGPCLATGFNDKQKVEAYRLLALTHLANDSAQAAYEETAKIFRINPNYEANIFDPPVFIGMVAQLKSAGGMLMVTSVSKRAENLDEVPATMIVLTRTQIRERGYQDLVELLKDVPGFDLTMFYGSEYANIYQRGFRQNNTEKTLLLIDGIEENDLWTNWAYIDRQYPLSNIEQVEIIYGPASTMYGPNAFAGVINVITRQASGVIRDGKTTAMSASAGYGTYNTRFVDMNFNGKRRSLAFSLTGRLYYSDEMDLSSQEYFDYDPSYYDGVNYQSLLGINNNATQFLINNSLPLTHPYYTLTAGGNQLTLTQQGLDKVRSLDKSAYDMVVNGSKVGFTNQSKQGLINGKVSVGNFTAGFQTWKYSRGSTTQYTDTYVPGSENGFAWVPQLTYFFTSFENQVNDKLFFSNLTTYRIHALTQDSRFVSVSNYARGNLKLKNLVNEAPPFWTTQYAHEISKQLRTEFKLIYTPGSRFDLVSGLEIRNGSLQGSYLFSLTPTPQDSAVINPSPKGGNSFNTWDIGFYSQGTFQALDDLKLTLGVRYDYNRVRTSGGFGSVISPRVAAVYTPGKYTFKAIYSRGIMNVSNWTKYSSAGNRIPNPGLKTENIQNLEVNGSVRMGRDFQADVNIYRSYINDVVGTVPVPGQPGFTYNDNIGKFVITGLQSNLSYRYNTLTVWLNYTFCDPRQTFAETGAVDNRVGDIASHQFNAGVNKLFFSQLNINLRSNFTGRREVGEGTTVPLNRDDFPAVMIFNSAATYSNPKVLRGIELQLVCNNLLNTTWYHPGTKAADGINSPTAILQRGRHFVMHASYNF
jgi:outer membrane receptor for ferrienterochelin and colicins